MNQIENEDILKGAVMSYIKEACEIDFRDIFDACRKRHNDAIYEETKESDLLKAKILMDKHNVKALSI